MIINYLDVLGRIVVPSKTNSPLIVDTNAVSTGAIAMQQFESITGRGSQVIKPGRRIDHVQLSACDSLYSSESPHGLLQMQPLGICVSKAANHGGNRNAMPAIPSNGMAP